MKWNLVLAGLLACFAGSIVRTARAEPDAAKRALADRRFLVVPVTREDAHLSALSELVAAIERELAARKVAVLPNARAATLLEDRHSREPQPISQEDLDALLAESQLASRAAADRRISEAKRHVAEVQARVSGALESLNRDEQAAQAYFGACLAHIRALVSERDRTAALRVARECRAAVPDLEPSPLDNPPSVMNVFRELQQELLTRGTGLMQVESAPTGCRVIVNGRFLGTTPHPQRAPVGQRYAVQVECGEQLRGRVHDIEIRTEPTALFVDTFFEAAVRTMDRTLRLSYARAEDPSTREHALELAKHLDVDELVLVSSIPGGARIMRVGRGTSTTSLPATRPELLSVLEFLLSDSSPSTETSAPSTESASFPAAPRQGPARASRIIPWVGAALAAGGATAFVLARLRLTDHRNAGDELKVSLLDSYTNRLRRWEDTRLPPYLFAGIASPVLSVGAVLVHEALPPIWRRWLSPVAAVSGVALVASGAAHMLKGERCHDPAVNRRECIGSAYRRDQGALQLLAAVPMLTVAATHLLEWTLGSTSSSATVRASFGARSARLWLSTSF